MAGQLWIMRGISGSGKSHEARRLSEESGADGRTVAVHSTDDHFLAPDGTYVWDETLLGEHHRRNHDAVLRSIEGGIDTVIVDNTNVSSREIRPWAEMGFLADYRLGLREPTSPWWVEVRSQIGRKMDHHACELLAWRFRRRNIHAVPLAGIMKQLRRWQNEDSLDQDIREMLAL